MRRRKFIGLAGGLIAYPLAAAAQKASKIPRVGVLWHAGSAEEEGIYLETFRQGLSAVGYIEGQNILLEHRFPAEIPERFISQAAELAALNIDILVGVNRPGALAAQRATATIPIVFIFVSDPVGSKLVASLAHPGGNITGLSNFAHDLAAKRLECLKSIAPKVSRVALLINPSDKGSAQLNVAESEAAAQKLRLTVRPTEIAKVADIVPAFSKMASEGIDGVVMSQDGLFYAARRTIADLALAQSLPMVVYSRETAEAGALAAYGASVIANFHRAGVYIKKILEGAKPIDLPVEQPTKFEFIINLKTAKALGLDVPQPLLLRADEVIE